MIFTSMWIVHNRAVMFRNCFFVEIQLSCLAIVRKVPIKMFLFIYSDVSRSCVVLRNHMHLYETFDIAVLRWNSINFESEVNKTENCSLQQTMLEKIHRRAHKVLWSFEFFPPLQSKRNTKRFFKVVSPACLSQQFDNLTSPDMLTFFFPAKRFVFNFICHVSTPRRVGKYLHGNARERHNSSGKIAAVILFFALSLLFAHNSSINVSTDLKHERERNKIFIYYPSASALEYFRCPMHCAWDCGQIIELVWTFRHCRWHGHCQWHY